MRFIDRLFRPKLNPVDELLEWGWLTDDSIASSAFLIFVGQEAEFIEQRLLPQISRPEIASSRDILREIVDTLLPPGEKDCADIHIPMEEVVARFEKSYAIARRNGKSDDYPDSLRIRLLEGFVDNLLFPFAGRTGRFGGNVIDALRRKGVIAQEVPPPHELKMRLRSGRH